ncbi:MAG: potassium-transporting ATPase subunit KdpC [Acidobacteriaceae bacterium]|jgi:potassium-transporting ATPase KdpC subunit
MKSVLNVAIRYTIVTTLLLGVAYPLLVTGIAQLTMRKQADGQLILRKGQVIGSAIIGQNFSSDGYFHGRLSAAGNGYDATNSGGSNYGPTNKKLIDRIDADVAALQKQDPGKEVPIGLVTTSASGLDPDISPEGALYQVPRVAAARHLPESTVLALVERHVEGRQFGFLGEPRVNVLRLNLDLDRISGDESAVTINKK